MFSLQKLLGKGDQFFDLFESSAQQCCIGVEAVKQILKDPSVTASLSDLRRARSENKRVIEKIDEMVVKTFVTVLEREDIEALSSAIYKIPKPLEKFAERFLIVSSLVSPDLFRIQMGILELATASVLKMVQELRRGVNIEKIKVLNASLHQAEAEADKLELDLLRDLYNNNKEPMKALIMKDLYDLLEKVVDRCRDAGNVITHIFLKNS